MSIELKLMDSQACHFILTAESHILTYFENLNEKTLFYMSFVPVFYIGPGITSIAIHRDKQISILSVSIVLVIQFLPALHNVRLQDL